MSVFRSHYFINITKIVIIVLSAASLLLFFYQSIRNHNYAGGNDLTSYLNSSRLFFSGENPYVAHFRGYIYPLFLLIVSYPLSFLQSNYFQKAVAAAAWSLLSYFAFFKTVFTSWKYLGYHQKSWAIINENMVKLALLVLLLHPFLQDEFLNGQVNLIMLGGMAGFFFMLERKQQLAAAIFLAIAASLKISPAICLVYVLFTRQLKTIAYFILFAGMFNIVLPLLINNQSLDYYSYFITEIMPSITGSEFQSGFRSYSIISTLSYLFGVQWSPSLRIVLIGLLTSTLLLPAFVIIWQAKAKFGKLLRLTFFAGIITILPLVFPMSESHHLLMLVIPVLIIIEYWQKIQAVGSAILRDRLSVWFLIFLTILHLGQVFKPTPLKLMGLLGIYFGMLMLLKKTSQVSKDNIL